MDIDLVEKIFAVQASNFEEIAIAVFQYQYQHCTIYRHYVNAIHVNADSVSTISEIPFLPISFFKTHQVVCGEFSADLIFKSSGTTSQNTAKHFVKNKNIYEASFNNGIAQFYNNINLNKRNYKSTMLLIIYEEQSPCRYLSHCACLDKAKL